MKKWLLLAVVGLMSACSKSDIEEVNTSIGSESPTFYASLEGGDETRTYLDANQKMRWTTDDRVTIFFGENYNREFAFTGETGSTAGSFNQKSTDGFYTAEKVTANYAVYPHQASTQLEVEGYFKFSLPATQSYAEDSFGLNANTMVAVTKTVEDRFLQFKNVCGYLKLNLYGANVTVKSITLTGNNEEPLAGAATVTPTYGGDPSMAWAASGTTTSLTLDCGDGVKIGATEAEATPFWLVVPPTTFTKGFTVTITDTAGNTFTKSSTSKQTITRNISKNMPAFEVKTTPTGPANNEIWYTSTDGKIVTPNRTDAFGAKITSNIYENGKGVITFGGDVTIIGESAFETCRTLVNVTLPNSVTEIGKFAFNNCFALTDFDIPNNVNKIDEWAFHYCTNLTSITIPESTTSIGSYAFAYCSSLKEFKGKFAADNGCCLIVNGDLTAFAVGNTLSAYDIPEDVISIGPRAFADCAELAQVTLPTSLKTIGSEAFVDCDKFKALYCKPINPPLSPKMIFYSGLPDCKIYVPAESVAAYKAADGWSEYADAIVGYDFEKGEIVEEVVPAEPANNEIWYTSTDGKIVKPYAKDPFGVAIKSNTYENGKGMITFDGDVKTIGEDAFRDCTSLASITLPEGVTTIGDRAFSFCTSLASVTIPEGLTTIGLDTFYGCTSLAKFEGPLVTSDQRCIVIDGALVAFAPAELFEYVIPEGVTTIGEYAFSRCKSLASITLPEGLTTIGKSAFRFCESLKSITLPEGVTTIGRDAFYGCTSLAKFEGPLATSDQRCIVIDGALVAFAPAELFEYVIPEGVTTIGAGAFEHCTSLASITLPEGITEIGQGAFFYCTSLASITLPEGLTTIGNSAFSVCTSLASITLPEGITSIGEYVFSECTSLASITLPKGLTTIGKSAFNRCTSLASITLPEGVTTIESYTFEDCTSLASITLPEGLTTIGSGTFYRCSSLHSVTLPEGVTEIGQAAFYQCTSLASVYCKPTTPPTGGTDMFRNNASGRKIYVPAGSVDAYKAAQYWKNFASVIVGYDFETGTIIADTGITDNSLDSSKYLVYVGNHSTAFAVTSSRDYNVWETYFEHSASGFSVAEYKFQLPEITTAWTPISDDDITIKGSVIRVYNGSRYNNNDDRVPVYTSFDLSTIDVDPTSVITLRIDDANDVVTINGKEMKGAIETAMSKYIYSSYYYEYDEGAYRQYDGIGEGTKLYYAKGWDEYGRLKYLGYASKAINPDTANEEACWKSQCYTNNSIEEKETFANNRYLSGEYIPLGMGNL